MLLILGGVLLSIVLYYYMLPGAIEKAVSRVSERISGLDDIEKYEDEGAIPIKDFVSKLTIRLVSHFTPVSVFLALMGLVVAVQRIVSSALREKFSMDTITPEFILFMFFLMGVPSALLLYTGSFIHPYFTYQWIPFFILGSWMGLTYLMERLSKWKKWLAISFIGIFLIISIPRSYIKVSGKSLIDLFFNGKVPTWYKQTS